MTNNAQKIEALLFFLNEEMGKKKLADMVGVSLGELEEALQEIQEARGESGIVLVQTATTVSLGTHPDCAGLIAGVSEAETTTPLSKAALETLSVILYKSPITRAEIDTIRGVNSLYSVRNLLVRGLVSRRSVEGRVIYEPTSDTLQLLGITKQSDMLDYSEVLEKIEAIGKQESSKEAQDTKNQNSVEEAS